MGSAKNSPASVRRDAYYLLVAASNLIRNPEPSMENLELAKLNIEKSLERIKQYKELFVLDNN